MLCVVIYDYQVDLYCLRFTYIITLTIISYEMNHTIQILNEINWIHLLSKHLFLLNIFQHVFFSWISIYFVDRNIRVFVHLRIDCFSVSIIISIIILTILPTKLHHGVCRTIYIQFECVIGATSIKNNWTYFFSSTLMLRNYDRKMFSRAGNFMSKYCRGCNCQQNDGHWCHRTTVMKYTLSHVFCYSQHYTRMIGIVPINSRMWGWSGRRNLRTNQLLLDPSVEHSNLRKRVNNITGVQIISEILWTDLFVKNYWRFRVKSFAYLCMKWWYSWTINICVHSIIPAKIPRYRCTI